MRYALWNMTSHWHEHYAPCIWRSRATEEQKRVGWEMWVRMEKIIYTVLDEAHTQQEDGYGKKRMSHETQLSYNTAKSYLARMEAESTTKSGAGRAGA